MTASTRVCFHIILARLAFCFYFCLPSVIFSPSDPQIASSIIFHTQTHTHIHIQTHNCGLNIHMASVSGKSITSKVITQTWQPKAAPRGDWHGTWHAIHHQSHVAVILRAASVSDLCMCVCRIRVCVAVFCVPAKPLCTSRREQKLDKTRKIIYTPAMRETF